MRFLSPPLDIGHCHASDHCVLMNNSQLDIVLHFLNCQSLMVHIVSVINITVALFIVWIKCREYLNAISYKGVAKENE